MNPLYVGSPVRKAKGYEFDGTVVSVFHNLAGEVRFVVEHGTSVGMLHIFNREQLELRT
jgi:hypothetical protein